MLIAQISDLHVHTEGNYAYGVVNTLPMVDKAIEHINRLNPRPDVVVATGDLTHHGEIPEYGVLRQLLAKLEIPLYLLLGNHDRREAIRETLGDLPWVPASGQYLQYVVDDYPVRLIMLDTLLGDEDGGMIDEPRLNWLGEQLAISPNVPTFLFLHHPPFDTGIPTMDCIGLKGRERLGELVSQYPSVKRIAAGHLHRPIFTQWAGTVASTAPSLVHQVALNLRSEVPGEFVMEPPAYQLHQWNNDTQTLVSHTVYVGDYPGPYPFST
ncbi:MAG: phosphodiesterase [Leptolyngbya foveolarum]|uniref:Phosphodiesterase n=1 Tax=Leptolyngbya foveolarum TaxID=47253 RepID=A0A2W4UEW1_9CYAN|nr:MAG: phosphodiesterase [Leptolyngbya foveolarum]